MIIILSLVGVAALLDAASYKIPAFRHMMDRIIDGLRFEPIEEDE